jgi:hypothetical protein
MNKKKIKSEINKKLAVNDKVDSIEAKRLLKTGVEIKKLVDKSINLLHSVSQDLTTILADLT